MLIIRKLRGALWLPAGMLILAQVGSGLRDLPQSAFFLIYLQEQLGLAPVTISSVVAGAQMVGMVTALLGGAFTGKLGSKWTLVTGLALSGLGSLALQAPTLGLAALLWFIGGAGLALTTVGGASYLTRIGGRGGLGVLAAFYALSMTVGGALGNPLAGVLIERYGFGLYSWSSIVVSMVLILCVSFFMPALPDPLPEAGARRISWASGLAIARQTNTRMVVGLRMLATIFYGMLVVLIPLLINELSGSKALVAAYGTTNLVVASAAQLLAGRSADRWGARLPTLAAFSILILSGLGLASSAGTTAGLFGFGVLGIAAAWSLSTLMYVWVNDGISKADHPAAFGLLHAVWSLSMMTGSVLGGWLVTGGPGLPFLLGGLLNLTSIFLALVFYRRLAMQAAGLGVS